MQEYGNGYYFISLQKNYADIEQRWVVIYSEHAYEREMKTFEKRLEKDLKHLRNKPFACESDAEQEAVKFKDRLRHQILEFEVEPRHFYLEKAWTRWPQREASEKR